MNLTAILRMMMARYMLVTQKMLLSQLLTQLLPQCVIQRHTGKQLESKGGYLLSLIVGHSQCTL